MVADITEVENVWFTNTVELQSLVITSDLVKWQRTIEHFDFTQMEESVGYLGRQEQVAPPCEQQLRARQVDDFSRLEESHVTGARLEGRFEWSVVRCRALVCQADGEASQSVQRCIGNKPTRPRDQQEGSLIPVLKTGIELYMTGNYNW